MALPNTFLNFVDVEKIFQTYYSSEEEDLSLTGIAKYFGELRNIDRLGVLKTIILQYYKDDHLIPSLSFMVK